MATCAWMVIARFVAMLHPELWKPPKPTTQKTNRFRWRQQFFSKKMANKMANKLG